MSKNDMVAIVVACIATVLIVGLIIVGGYTKAQNDQEYVQIVADSMSEEDFAEFMENKQMHGVPW